MKRAIVLAIVSLAELTLAPAYAQGSMTLYGLMDTGLARISNVGGSGSTELRGSNALTSRLGLRGREELGGGLNAQFNLEATLGVDTGSATFFNRQSWVGLASDQWGQVTLGRQLPTMTDVFLPSLVSVYLGNAATAIDGAAVGAGSSVARFNNMVAGTRVDNAIKYQSNNFSGFRGHAMLALGEVAGSASAGRIASLGGSYISDSLEGGLVYHERQCGEAGGCPAGKDKDKIFGVGGAYKFSGNRVGVIYTRQKNALNTKGSDADVIDLLVRVPLGLWVLAGGYQVLNDRTQLNQDVRQGSLGINYLLSKRTLLYTLYSHQSVKNGGKAGMFGLTSSNGSQTQFSAGVLHTF